MTTARAGKTTQTAALVPRSGQPRAVTTQVAALVPYMPPSTKLGRTTQVAALVPHAGGTNVVARTTQVAALVVYGTGIPGQSRSRAWTFDLDGHTFYVLNLSQEGTFIYDTVTNSWAQFDTEGFGQWNFVNGTAWGQSRVVGGDSISPQIWELDPTAVLDEGWRDLVHTVTGGLATRSRKFLSCESVRLTASFGTLDEVNGASMTLTFSDDGGNTWSQPFTVPVTEGGNSAEIAWRSLGAFMSPGRVFQITDTGGVVRIDGADAFVDNFDDDAPQQGGGQQGG